MVHGKLAASLIETYVYVVQASLRANALWNGGLHSASLIADASADDQAALESLLCRKLLSGLQETADADAQVRCQICGMFASTHRQCRLLLVAVRDRKADLVLLHMSAVTCCSMLYWASKTYIHAARAYLSVKSK